MFKHSKKLLASLVAAAAISSAALPDHQADAYSSSRSVASTAVSLKGIPYKYGGSTRSGFDCSGYVSYVYRKSGISLPRTASAMHRMGRSVSKSSLRSGDLVFFRTTKSRSVSHVGIYVGGGKFAHASTSRGVMVSNVNDRAYWGKRYAGAKRIGSGTMVASRN